MAITLTTYETPANLVKSGTDPAVAVAAGQKLKMETTPNGEEILTAPCPVGKKWSARIIVEITETDA